MSTCHFGRHEMPPNRAVFSPFPPTLQPRLRPVTDGTFTTEDTVQKRTILSEGYAGRADGREELGRRYQAIGISAVAAAVRYQGGAKPAAAVRDDDQARTDPAA
jgi:hypothetical protein